MDLVALKRGTELRGTAVGENAVFTGDAAKALAMAFAKTLAQRLGKQPHDLTIAIGRDTRLTSPSLLRAAAEGVAALGATAYDYGICTTPAMYLSILDERFAPDGAIMITACHHEWRQNGMRFFTENGGISESTLDAILRTAQTLTPPAVAAGVVEARDYLSAYQEHLRQLFIEGVNPDVAMPLLGLHVVVDAGNGVGGFYAKLLEGLGAWIEGSQFLNADGRFPNHIPDPESKEAMAALSEAVKRHGADIGVLFDTDCDRAAVVDEHGRAINRNRLIALVSAILLDERPGSTIVTDSVTSSGVGDFIREWGGVHYRFRRGYRNVIDEAMRLNDAGVDCPLAIETSGHVALRENHFLDDGVYLATRLLIRAMRLKQQGEKLDSLLDGLKEPVESYELRLPVTDGDPRAVGRQIIEQLMDRFNSAGGCHIAPDNREGVRICFDLDNGLNNGWLMLRLSVHDPVLPLNVESDVPGGSKTMLLALQSALRDAQGVDASPIEALLSTL